MSETIASIRTIEVIEMELRVLQDQTQRAVLGYAIEAGRRLEEAKEMLDHGQWGDWLRHMGYAKSTANNLMRIFREYGTSQQSLFGGEANSQALANLSFTKALRLLALPDEEERERFVAEHDVESMSTRELEQALRERDEALRRAEASDAEAAAAREARDKLSADMGVANASLKDQKKQVKRLKGEADRLQAEVNELKSRPVEVAVREPSPEEIGKLVDRARAEDRERLAALEKQLASADGDTAAFRVLFDAWQDNYGRMMRYLERIRSRDGEKAGKLRAAVRAAVERMVAG